MAGRRRTIGLSPIAVAILGAVAWWLLPTRESVDVDTHRLNDRTRFAYRDGRATMDIQRDVPRRVPGMEGIVADLWTACRTGFADGRWVAVRPWEDGVDFGPAPDLDWGRMVLPYAWARGWVFYVGTVPETGNPEWILATDLAGGQLFRLQFRDFWVGAPVHGRGARRAQPPARRADPARVDESRLRQRHGVAAAGRTAGALRRAPLVRELAG